MAVEGHKASTSERAHVLWWRSRSALAGALHAITSKAGAINGRVRSRHLFVVDSVGIAASSLLALSFAQNRLPSLQELATLGWLVVFVFVARTSVNVGGGLYRRAWRFASVPDMRRLIECAALGSGIAIAAVVVASEARLIRVSDLPDASYWIIELALTLTVLAGPRFAIRAMSEAAESRHDPLAGKSQRTLLYGAGYVGVTIARSARRDPSARVDPVGFMDDDPGLTNRHVAGLEVFGGLGRLEQTVRRTGASALLITMPSASGDVVRSIVEIALGLQLEVRTVPPITDLIDGSIDAHRIRKVRLEDLLRRPMASEHAPEVADVFADRCVVITGAAGSIGSELARQVLSVHPRRIVLVDRAESPLYLVEREMESRLARERGRATAAPQPVIASRLTNVASHSMMEQLIESERPDVILHAAAYKHVPMLEEHPTEAVQVNVGGTLAVLDAAERHGVGRVVLVSTDKAVRPSSVMGATKRIAEMLVAESARRSGRPYVSVRFGNVLGSNGSVVPIFQDQLERGAPLTITDLRMTRFFMTISEASWLILDAAALGQAADLFILDMGQPLRIVDLARDLARLAGRDPDSIPIEVVGLRPGEKLHEELMYSVEEAEPTSVAKVLRVLHDPHEGSIRKDAKRLLELATGEREAELRTALHRLVQAVDADARASEASPGSMPAARTLDDRMVAVPIETGDRYGAYGSNGTAPIVDLPAGSQVGEPA